jgi:hypothetical protein
VAAVSAKGLPAGAPRPFGKTNWCFAGLVIAAVVAAYANSFRGVFVFDDLPAILENETIKPGTGPAQWLQPRALSTVAGRPVLNLTFALNQAISADATWSYHALNLLIHLGAGGLLFGIVRRTLRRRGIASAAPAGAIAALWLLHPLQTESVTYLVQRAESLMGLLYLGSLYCFVRAVESPHARRWFTAAVSIAFLGMAAKENYVTLPCLLLLYDRCFVAGSFSAAWRARRGCYLALASSWSVLIFLMAGAHDRGGSAGFGAPASAFGYALTQLYAVVHYLRLTFFPHPLVFDYGRELQTFGPGLAAHAVIYVALLIATLVASIVRPAIGFVGAAFFLLLAPTSTVVPVATQTMAEHRMYLPLAAPIAGAVLASHFWLRRKAVFFWAAAGAGLALATFERNRVYQSPLTLWSDTVTKLPRNARAHDWLGLAARDTGETERARQEFQHAVALEPANAKFHNNFGVALATLGRLMEARDEFSVAFALDPAFVEARHNLAQAETRIAVVFIRGGRTGESIPHLRRAAELEPGDPAAAQNLALALEQVGPSKNNNSNPASR